MNYFTLAHTKEVEFTEKKSVFIGVGKRVFSEDGIEEHIYKSVMNKKNYTLSIFKKDFNGFKIPK